MDDEPELHLIKLPELPGAAERRAERERHRAEARRRFVARLVPILEATTTADAETQAIAALDALTVWNDINSGDPCHCSCHPRLPDGDLHDYGFDCPCRQTPEKRRARFDAWMANIDEFWNSPEGQRISAARQAERDEVASWLREHPTVVIRRYGGLAPEQWWGEVDGHSFYFRERHDHWRIELDLRPSGRHYRAWTGGDLDDDANSEFREIEEGEVIAEGATSAEGYDATPLERLLFIVGTIRGHLRSEQCTVHTGEREELEILLGPFNYCPECGTPLS